MHFFQRLYYFYFYALLAVLFVLLYPAFVFLLKDPKNHPKAHKVRKFGCRALLFLTGIRYKIEKQGDIDFSQTYIITPNHTSNLDIFVLLAALPGYFCFMGKAELVAIPLFGISFKKGLDIEVERGSTENSALAYKRTVTALRNHKSVVIFPEGGIFPDPYYLNPFKEGAFRIAIRQKTPVLPIVLPDNHKLLPDEEKRAKAGKIRIILHNPIDTSSLKDSDSEVLKNQVYQLIAKDISRK
ncbi:MAG: lysophospholipid acyltransferase family protein [Bacteroidia bacterium]